MTSRFKSKIKTSTGVGKNSRTPQIHSRKANKSFPYIDEFEEFSYEDEELETVNNIIKKTKTSHHSQGSLDSKDRSSATDIIKISEIAKGLSPFPSMYKKREGHLGKSAESISNIHSHGFSMGSNLSGHTYDRVNLDDESDEPVYSLEDLAIKQLKEYIRTVITEVL